MREVHFNEIVEKVKNLVMDSEYRLPQDFIQAIKVAVNKEESPLGKEILQEILKNAEVAEKEQVAYCQDTGYPVFFVEVGQDVKIVGGSLREAINEGVRRATKEGYLRASLAYDPIFDRKNTQDNTPALIYFDIIEGDKIKIKFAAKGGGSENQSKQAMLKPADGIEGVKKFVLQTIANAGPNACPPFTVGVGIGGTFDYSAVLAKKALFRHIGERHPDPRIAALEEELLNLANQLGVGPLGFGGTTTAVDVKIEIAPCHIASLPVAVNIQCHAARHKEIEI
ncbi:L(+)-tartrate dehydratase subunit alpha (L-TTD alpha) [Sulfurihydrogenibium azorense Az-Fu1]|jgi:fumarate hydratase subunit alpha|uniref:L(+)-tartrate dehydratase subunit alpha (L-TTD alpha) n=1 Tax=Sulfurihydrogenibium azorense (strain DSM 15241 / OCM 825 / Az-Fu1) TaxID=204536 RepID=C1DU33_SULAA|nr:fumarate hydratase [Sulfurihydrogenibium azorense]ACN98178.1 L(+)-tartrate dehydratase subunit alpha (L-TTD alpha) [Sulfurihydrogenibium azorense Az-Fu1]